MSLLSDVESSLERLQTGCVELIDYKYFCQAAEVMLLLVGFCKCMKYLLVNEQDTLIYYWTFLIKFKMDMG